MPTGAIVQYLDDNRRGMVSPHDTAPDEYFGAAEPLS